MFSQTNEYALRVITYLGANQEKPCRNTDISTVTKVPVDYLYKILQTLQRAGLVRAQRGKNGGYTLERPPQEISVFDVVQAVDPLPRIHSCPLKLKSHGTHLCPLHKKLDSAFCLIEESFRKSSIADLLAERTSSVPLCEGPV